MDVVKLIEIFKNTINSEKHDEAEEQLEQIHKIISFLPSILQIVMDTNIELPIRQAAVIYFKNEINQYWEEKKSKNNVIQYHVHEQDRELIRNSIIDALVLSPDVIRNNLSSALNHIIKLDYPTRWTGIVDKIVFYLQTPEPNNWMGALLALMQLARAYEYKIISDKSPLLDALKVIAPLVYKLMVNLMPDNSENSVLIQKTILKIIFIITQYSLPLSLFTNEFFTQWMEIIRQVLDRPVPPEVNDVDIEGRPELPWYKAKKWALHIVVRIFERYAPCKNQAKQYKPFGKWYLETFSMGMIQVICKMLDQYHQNVYLPPRVLQQCINYLITCLQHMHTWKILKPHISAIIERVIFPLMCYSEEDAELWACDPEEYVRKKFDFFEDYVSPVGAAQNFLLNCCKKRKDMLNNTITFAIQILSSPNSTPQQKDGALNMIGSVFEIMLKKKQYHQQIDDLIAYHVFPYFSSHQPFLRARAAWMLHFLHDFEFENELTLCQAVNSLQYALINDKELPVGVQAAISLHILITSNEKTKPLLEPNLETIILESLNMIKLSQNDDVSNGLLRVICSFGEKIIPISVKIIEHIVNVLEHVGQSNSENNDVTITLMGLLTTIDTVLMMVSEKALLQQVEPLAMRGVLFILNQEMSELYEESFNIVTTLTEKSISPDMWKMFEYIYQISTKPNGVDYFVDLVPTLHNLITVDPDAFLSDSNRLVAFYEICKLVLTSDVIEDTHCNAIKMIEVLLLQFREKVANYMPSFCELILDRLLVDPNDQSADLKNLILQVFLVVLYVDHNLFFKIMEQLNLKFPTVNILEYLLENWLKRLKRFYGLHDRKICILALCKLLTLPSEQRPPKVYQLASQLMPDILNVFENLKEAYKTKAINDKDDSDEDSDYEIVSTDEEENDDDYNGTKDMDDDYFDDEADLSSDDEHEDEDENENELTPFERLETTIDKEDTDDDEYILFRNTVELLKNHDQNLYQCLFGNLNPKEIVTLEDIYLLAQRRQDAAESRKIEQRGGYTFSVQTVPTTFNFGGNQNQ